MSVLAASRIFNKIFGKDIISNIKFPEDVKALRDLLLNIAHFGIQYKDLFFIVSAGCNLEPKDFITFVNDEICKRGFAARVWINVNDLSKQVAKEFIKKTAGINPRDFCIKALCALSSGTINLRDAISSILLKVLGADYFIFNELVRNYSVPSSQAVENILKQAANVDLIVEKILKVCDNWRISSFLFGFHNEITPEDVLNFIDDKMSELQKREIKKIDELISLPKLVTFLVALSLPEKPSGQISFDFLQEILALITRGKYSLSALSYVIESFQKFDDEKIGAFIALSLAHKYYGAELYVMAIEKITMEKIYPVSIDILMENFSERTRLRLVTAALRNLEVVKLLNATLSDLGRAPCIILGIPWELTIPKEKIADEILKAVQIYERNKIIPPQLLEKMKGIINIAKSVSVMAKENNLDTLIECWKQIARAEAEISWVFNYTRLITEQEVPILSDLRDSLEEIKEKVFKSLEYFIIREYENVLKGKSKYKSTKDVLSVVKQLIKQGYFVILLVIDGLRLDDYIAKLKREFMAIGLRPLQESVVFALIPTITIYSRHAIFYGRQPDFFAYTSQGINLRREDEMFEYMIRYTSYACGSIREVLSQVKNLNLQRISKLQALAIVLSELEKAVHGSPEAFLAHMPESFAREVASLIKEVIKFFSKHKKKIAIIVTSDHGLAEFFDTTSVNVKIFKYLRRKRALDPVFSVVETPRFAIFPFISEVELNASLHEIEQMCKGEAYAIPAKKLGINRIALMIRKAKVMSIIDASRILFLFPKGRRKFETKIRQIVLHGGIHPIEVIVPLACWVASNQS